ncbi:hypothetical protein K0M31_000477 [Melipona bicolor]|uniref:Uncharacterized protein n=1 Tax=Melipona bicolor TaxID=60889 RepID=A0AA40KWV8_9HYME|nr:hypothetical protein K0M31_000477 [Melipona bicolor]
MEKRRRSNRRGQRLKPPSSKKLPNPSGSIQRARFSSFPLPRSVHAKTYYRVCRWEPPFDVFGTLHKYASRAPREKPKKEVGDERGQHRIDFPRRVNNLSNSYSLRSIRRISAGKQWCPGIDFPNVRIPRITCQGVSQYYSGNDAEHSWNSYDRAARTVTEATTHRHGGRGRGQSETGAFSARDQHHDDDDDDGGGDDDDDKEERENDERTGRWWRDEQ